MNNPFVSGVIPPGDPFCDRTKELKELTSYAGDNVNVVLYSPRRYGKTSLVKRVQSALLEKGCVAVYVDLYGVSNMDDVAARTARSVFSVTHPNDSLFKKTVRILKAFRPVLRPAETGSGFSLSVEAATESLRGPDLLRETMENLGEFIQSSKDPVHIAFDEFQEIVEIDGLKVEGILRSYVQVQRASYFFVGSRRRVLLDMFGQRNRPFFQSSILYELPALPHDDLVAYISNGFKKAGKSCPEKVAQQISQKVAQHPFYAQKLSFYVFEMTKKTAQSEDVDVAYWRVLEEEKFFFEAILQGLTLKQIALLKAIARTPHLTVFSSDFLAKYRFSQGMVQNAVTKLHMLDLIERTGRGTWRIVDPVFSQWLKGM